MRRGHGPYERANERAWGDVKCARGAHVHALLLLHFSPRDVIDGFIHLVYDQRTKQQTLNALYINQKIDANDPQKHGRIPDNAAPQPRYASVLPVPIVPSRPYFLRFAGSFIVYPYSFRSVLYLFKHCLRADELQLLFVTFQLTSSSLPLLSRIGALVFRIFDISCLLCYRQYRTSASGFLPSASASLYSPAPRAQAFPTRSVTLAPSRPLGPRHITVYSTNYSFSSLEPHFHHYE